MRRIGLVVALLVACGGEKLGQQQITVRASGLWLGPSELQAPDGAMTVADDVVISREGVVETRRGQDVSATKAMTRLFAWQDALIGHGTATLSRATDSGVTWSDYSGSYSPISGYYLRGVEAASNWFFLASDGVKRIDSLTGTPEASGISEGLDVELALSAGAGTAMPTASMLAYRVIFVKEDANGRLVSGAPSGRATIANSSGSTKDVNGNASLPRGLTSSHRMQVYRSQSSATASTDPGDELGLVYDATVSTAKTATQLSRTTNVVTVSSVAHGFSAGQIVRVSPGGSVAGATITLGGSAKQRSTDNGATWSSAGITITSGIWQDVVSSGAIHVAVGEGTIAASSADGLTWTDRTITPSGAYAAVAYGGGRFAAVGSSGSNAVGSYSTNGTSWTAATVTDASLAVMTDVVHDGSRFLAVGLGSDGTTGYCRTSTDGSTWSARVLIAANFTPYGVTWTGTRYVAVGQSGTTIKVYTSTDGTTWSAATITAHTGYLAAVTWTGTAAVAVGNTGNAYYSSDGTSWSSTTLAGTWASAVWDGVAVIATGTNVAATATANGQTWTSRTITAGTYEALGALASGAVFAAGEYTISTAATDTFTYAETGTDGTLTQSQTLTPLTQPFTDTVPDGFTGAYLYTNESQEGILNGNTRPPLARDVTQYQGSLFLADVTIPAFASLDYLGGASNDDTITINGLAYTFKASESISARQFKLYTTGTVAENIRDTASSLARVVNRSLSSGVTVQYVSGPDDPPGKLSFTSSDSTSSLTITVSRAVSWSPSNGVSSDPVRYKNGILWSKTDQPDHFPRSQWLAPKRLGANDKAILRVVPTRSALFVLKEDGLWKITGSAGVWDFQPFDPTVRLVAPESAAPLDNTVFALAEQGVIRISDTGVSLMSRQPGRCDIEPAIAALLAPSMRSTTETYAFGVGYESDHKYVLWLPTASNDTKATQAYVYDLFTQTWTRRTDDASHGLVNPADDRLYYVDGTSVWRERKTLDYTDLADRSYAITISSGAGTTSLVLADATNVLVGDAISQGSAYAVVTAKVSNTVTIDRAAAFTNAAATSNRAISTSITWSPKYGSGPFSLSQFQEIALYFDSVYFATATLGFTTNQVTSQSTITVLGTDYGWTGGANSQFVLRAWPTPNHTWGTALNVSWSHAQAYSPNALSGLSVLFTRQGIGVSR